jgi:hypothetical protein
MKVLKFAGSLQERRLIVKRGMLRRAQVVLCAYSVLERKEGSEALQAVPWKASFLSGLYHAARLGWFGHVFDLISTSTAPLQVVVLDEAHALKNSESMRFASVLKLRVGVRVLIVYVPIQHVAFIRFILVVEGVDAASADGHADPEQLGESVAFILYLMVYFHDSMRLLVLA